MVLKSTLLNKSNESQSWYDFYKDRVNNTEYFDYFCNKYNPFLNMIQDMVDNNIHPIAEFGCGTANTTKALKYMMPRNSYVCYDKDSKMLHLARENLSDRLSNVLIHYWDVLDEMPVRHYQLVHTHGLLEHFDDDQIRKIFKNFTYVTDKQVHYIPLKGYEEPSYGDKRLLDIADWYKILREFKPSIRRFNGTKDGIITWNNTK